MSSPVELSDLPVAGSAADSDLTLLRKGLTDYQCAVSLIRQINISALSPLPFGYAVGSDQFMISRTVASIATNYSIAFSQVGLVKDTKAWFYQGTAPVGWTVIPNTGDRLLAVSDLSTQTPNPPNYYNGVMAPGQTGDWQQSPWTLTIDQIPAHSHAILGSSDVTSSTNTNYARYGKMDHAGNNLLTFPTGGANSADFSSTLPPGPTVAHNHGNTWRPLANIGILCIKAS